MAKAPGRILHAACGDGWLVQRIGAAGGDAYGVDPRAAVVERGLRHGSDLREESLAEHLQAVAPAGLAGIVVSGLVEGLSGGEREHLLTLAGGALAPGGTLVLHSVTREVWEGADAPPEADLASGHPLRAGTWCHLLEQRGYRASVQEGTGSYLVTAVRAHVTPLETSPDE